MVWPMTVGFRVPHYPQRGDIQTSLLQGQMGEEHEALMSGVNPLTSSRFCRPVSCAHARRVFSLERRRFGTESE